MIEIGDFQIYACSSPLTALIGFFAFHLAKAQMESELNLQKINYWNGYVMLVSVGTLLYITTMHMLPEVYPMHGSASHDHVGHNHE